VGLRLGLGLGLGLGLALCWSRALGLGVIATKDSASLLAGLGGSVGLGLLGLLGLLVGLLGLLGVGGVLLASLEVFLVVSLHMFYQPFRQILRLVKRILSSRSDKNVKRLRRVF